MHNRFKPLFILFSLFLFGCIIYFFTYLINKPLYPERSKSLSTEYPIQISSKNINASDSVKIFSYEGEMCLVSWDLKIEGLKKYNNLELYINAHEYKCDIELNEVMKIEKALLQKIVKYFDPNRLTSVFIRWPSGMKRNIYRMKEQIQTIFKQEKIDLSGGEERKLPREIGEARFIVTILD